MTYQNMKININNKIDASSDFVQSLEYDKYFFKPVLEGITDAGSELKLGFSCYGLKFYYMNGLWENLDKPTQLIWVDEINKFQATHHKFPKNSFIDPNYLYYLNKFNLNDSIKYSAKQILSLMKIKKYDSKSNFQLKSINAETKQAISTLFQINHKNEKLVKPEFDESNLIKYLHSLDWSRPWASGAQFSSMCVYSATQETYNVNILSEFSNNLVNKDSGFYYKEEPSDKRELFNGAMKIISGLDWIGNEIHYPKKIIDYCLKNKPIFEGCDIVDFIYILNKCSTAINYKRNQVVKLLQELSGEMDILFNEKLGGYSYFKDKSQTHYYGVNISKGKNTPDLHATLLCNWANIMILETMEELDGKFKTLKP
tara:strand:+ start:8078 stop:9187 length:1110 start_codon:yes stop_codon:yes gene_type:complete